MSPPLYSWSRTWRECSLDSSEVSGRVLEEDGDGGRPRLTRVVEVGLVAADDVAWVGHDE